MRTRFWIAIGAISALAGIVSFAVPSRAEGPYSFPHAPHLSEKTVEAGLLAASALQSGGRPAAGTDRECVACHDFGKADDAHLSGCAQCHIGDDYLEVERSGATAVGRRPFPHSEHLQDGTLSCFSCHRLQMEHDWVEFSVPAPGLGTRGRDGRPGGALGVLNCSDCHADHEPNGGLVSQDETTGDGRKCAECHMAATSILPLAYRADRATGVRPFRHGDHGGSGATCDTCHADIRGSQSIWDYDPTLGTVEACTSCHVSDAAGTSLIGLADPPRESELPFVAFSKFPHDAHLASEGKIDTSGKVTSDCRTCHYPETDDVAKELFPTRPAGSTEPVGRAELVEYRACEPCHTDWKVDNHGVGAWACFKCHGGDVDESGMLAMGSARVERDRLGTVAFTTHHHPGVTTGGARLLDSSQPDGKTCGDCHLGDVAELPARTGGKPFAHAPHVSEAAKTSECLACHTTAGTTSWSEDLRRFETHVGAVPAATGAGAAARGCLDCHVGATAEQLGLSTDARTVPQFDHKAHVTAGSWMPLTEGIPCSECHEPGGDVGYVVPEDVADCTRCHSHDPSIPEKFERTGVASSAGEAKQCLACHEEVVADDASPTRRITKRVHLDLLPGIQWHDRGGECALCHERDALAGRPSDYRERITKAKLLGSIHEDPKLAGEWFNDPRIAEKGNDPQGRTCMECHRSEPRGYLRSLGR